jgi:glycosyltransferase involved in cell wall biosynthesis
MECKPTGQKIMKKLVIIPAFNEEKTVKLLIDDLQKYCPTWDYLIVNDCSTDQTKNEANKTSAFVLNLSINLGIGGAVQTGFKWAIELNYDIAVQFDGDGQHKAEFLETIAQPVINGKADLCIGSRFIDGYGAFKSTIPRKVGMILFSFLYKALTLETIKDTTSGFRCYSKNLMNYYITNYPVDFPDLPVLLVAKKKGFRIIELPVQMRQREFGVSSTGFWKSIFYPMRTLVAAIAVYLSQESK